MSLGVAEIVIYFKISLGFRFFPSSLRMEKLFMKPLILQSSSYFTRCCHQLSPAPSIIVGGKDSTIKNGGYFQNVVFFLITLNKKQMLSSLLDAFSQYLLTYLLNNIKDIQIV